MVSESIPYFAMTHRALHSIVNSSVAFAAIGFVVPAASAAVLEVPVDHATIQAAIAAASPGDEIVVAPGVYRESVDLLGKTLTIRGAGAATTTIDASGLGDVLRFGAGANGRLEGFTLVSRTLEEFEKVLRVTNAAPTIVDCAISGNEYRQPYCPFIDRGILVRVDGGAPRFERTSFIGNRFDLPCSETVILGFVLGIESGAATLVDCRIEDNVIASSTPSSYLLWSNGALTIEGGSIADGSRGGIDAQGTALVMRDVRVSHCGTKPALHLGGVDSFAIERCEIVANTNDGVFLAFDSKGTIHRSTLAHNGAGPSGFDLTFETFPLFPWTGTLLIEESIVWGTGMAPGFPATATIVRYCDVTNGAPGDGNFALDPKFVAPFATPVADYRLAPGSPCIDAGDPNSAPDADGTIADVGAHPYQTWSAVEAGLAGSWYGTGAIHPNSEFALELSGAPKRSEFLLVVGDEVVAIEFPGFVLVPAPQVVLGPFRTDALGAARFEARWPSDATSGTTLVAQAFFDGSAAGASDGLIGVAP